MKLESLKENVGSLLDNLAEGWRHLTRFAASALTRFKAGEQTNLPAKAEVDDLSYLPTRGWAILGGELFEDGQRLVVKLEVPGLEKEDLDIRVQGDSLVVEGEKRFERESTEGRWRVMQCAYGSFRRVVALPVPVLADAARASYRNGVLRVEMPKSRPGTPQPVTIRVE
ncbi:Hsp20/alpha crystallin family protein [Thauera butanivorans]|uniref:Hsp20/alpha crystallin family protein n=1 Tax=Thauera butanivorans TaxID=86174 RepID=UPI000837BDBD|nr:Hsp20/alpha crystallin family protein [Thauera butanivorans]